MSGDLDSGQLLYAAGGIMPRLEMSLVWVNQRGEAQPAASFNYPFFAPRLSPDGQRIAYAALGRELNVWVYDLNRTTTSRLLGEGKAHFLTWTPDGRRVVIGWCKSGHQNLYWQSADGSSIMERLTTSDYYQAPGSFSPDGTTLAFTEIHHPGTGGDILLLDLQSRRVTTYLSTQANEGWPEFSPDGRWIAYASDESGQYEVYVRPFPGPGGKWQVSAEGGREPLWARNGKQLFYRSFDGRQVWVVDVRTDGTLSPGKPRFLFTAPRFSRGLPARCWDNSLDSQRFLMVRGEELKPQPVTELILVQNWLEELKRLVPTGK